MLGLGVGLSVSPGRRRSTSPPDWVLALRAPSGDLPWLASDFVNGRYWIDGVGICPVGDMWVENVLWSTFNLAAIIPGVGYQEAGGPTLSDAAFAKIGVNWTGVLTATTPHSEAGYVSAEFSIFDIATFASYSSGYFNDDVNPDLPAVDIHTTDPLQEVKTSSGAANNGQGRLAFNMTDGTRVAASFLGAVATGGDVQSGVTPPYDHAAAYLSQADGSIQSIVVYPTQAEADLQILSAL